MIPQVPHSFHTLCFRRGKIQHLFSEPLWREGDKISESGPRFPSVTQKYLRPHSVYQICPHLPFELNSVIFIVLTTYPQPISQQVRPGAITWSKYSIAIAWIGNDIGLIDSDPKLHLFSQPAEEHICILLKPLDYCIILPASNILECLGQIPVVNSHLLKKKSHQENSNNPEFCLLPISEFSTGDLRKPSLITYSSLKVFVT